MTAEINKNKISSDNTNISFQSLHKKYYEIESRIYDEENLSRFCQIHKCSEYCPKIIKGKTPERKKEEKTVL
jgi:hypothetical protein